MATFSEALELLKANKRVKRRVVKNDTVIIIYKKRLYQMSQSTGVRYPYSPSNRDLLAEDWMEVGAFEGLDLIEPTTKRTLIIYNTQKTSKKECQHLVDILNCDDSTIWDCADRCGVEIIEVPID